MSENEPKQLTAEELAAKEAKKAAKKAAKLAKQQEKERKKQERLEAESKANEVPLVATPDAANYGLLKLNNSAYKTDRKFIEIGTVGEELVGQSVWVRGRVHNIRDKGNSVFIVFRRGVYTIQGSLFKSEKIPKAFVKFAAKIPAESIVDIKGIVAKLPEVSTTTTQSTVEISIEKLLIVSASAPLPFQIEDASRPVNENDESKDGGPTVSQKLRLDNRVVDLRTRANHAIFKVQAAVCRYFREFFIQRDFVEIHTPKIIAGVSEGGSEVFHTSYFGTPACLAQSPQLYKQMSGAASDLFRVFEIGPVFRAENSNTPRHMCEFTGLDFEMEIMEHYHEVLDALGGVFIYIFKKLNENHKDELEAVREQYPFEDLKFGDKPLVLDFKTGVAMLREAGVEIGDYDDLSTPQEKKLGALVKEKYDVDYYILDKYPLAARPFYTMPDPENGKYTNSYDVFLRGQEITSGAQRIHDVELLAKRATECGIPLDNIESYLESFKYGVPPHGGAGIGMERVVMLFLGLNDIRKSSMFPRTPDRLNP